MKGHHQKPLYRTDSITSMEVNESQRALALTLATSQQRQNQPIGESITEIKKRYRRTERIPQEMEYTDNPRIENKEDEVNIYVFAWLCTFCTFVSVNIASEFTNTYWFL